VKPDKEKGVVTAVCIAIKAARIQQEISQQRLAEMAGISRTGLRHIESLETNPTLYSLLRVTHALGIDLADLLRGN
jgi:transcriptional regulator with XRE-family HTH domain